MIRESLLKFLGTGMIVLPIVLALGTGSLDVVALGLFVLLILQMGVLVVNSDDPIGDKMRADEAHKQENTQDQKRDKQSPD